MTEPLNLHIWTPFVGRLSLDSESIELEFNLRIMATGEIEMEFPKIPHNKRSSFIRTEHHRFGSNYADFSLVGKASDGTSFRTDRFHLSAADWNWNQNEGTQISIKGNCTTASLVRRSQLTPLPMLTMRLRGLSTFVSVHSTCRHGKISMAGREKDGEDETNHLSGWIAIQPESLPVDIEKWRSDASELLEHVRLIMSLSAAAMLKAPIREFRFNEELQIESRSQTRQTTTALRIMPEVAQDAIFEAAVSSFFDPLINAKNVQFAIEWFAMDAFYSEVRLVSAMTALENLVDSNLSEPETYIQDRKLFHKTTRRALRNQIKACLARWPADDAKQIVTELDEKLADLNRRSFIRKLFTLAERWSVPLEAINRRDIVAAIGARNSIVHRGQYYDDGKHANTELVDLWEHVTLIRELVARFLLTIIGYRGQYACYIGGFHIAQFPPASTSVLSK